MKARFVSIGRSCDIGSITIPNTGIELEDPNLIEFLRKSPVFGNWFYEVETTEGLENAILAHAAKIQASREKQEQYPEPVIVEPVEEPDLKEEQQAGEEEEHNLALDNAVDEVIREMKAEKEAKIREIRKARSGAAKTTKKGAK